MRCCEYGVLYQHFESLSLYMYFRIEFEKEILSLSYHRRSVQLFTCLPSSTSFFVQVRVMSTTKYCQINNVLSHCNEKPLPLIEIFIEVLGCFRRCSAYH